MNTTSKASNAFEAFFGIHELPPPPSPPTSPLLPSSPLPLVLTSSTLKARKLHWRNPTANIGIDIGIRIFTATSWRAQHGRGGGTRNTHTHTHTRNQISLCPLRPLRPLRRHRRANKFRGIHNPRCRTRTSIYAHSDRHGPTVATTQSIVTAGVPSLLSPRGRIYP